jgi:O-antigen biosynthesis protein
VSRRPSEQQAPRFSIVTPVYNPPRDTLASMLRSVTEQTYGGWEHCLVDDGSTEPHVRTMLEAASKADPRVRVRFREQNGGIVDASNDALAMATGELVVLLDHDDELEPQALQAFHQVMEAVPEVDYIYSDEDRIDVAGNRLGVFRKPGWSPERLRTQMYTCHLSGLRRSVVEKVGGFDPEFNGSQDWDLVLRVTEVARKVVHVPEVLYHWRALATSTASGADAKPWAFHAGTRALQAHCDRIFFQAEVTHFDELPGIYHLEPRLLEEPLVSIVIPTAGQSREVWAEEQVLVTHCVRSILDRSTYPNYEIVVVADHQVPPHVLAELQAIAGERLSVVYGAPPFNFSERINLGAAAARGEHLLLLNDDVEVTTPNWMERLVMYSAHPGIGVVGAKLLFGDGRLQHVGVIFDKGSPGHLFRGFSGAYGGHYASTLVANNYLGVTGACVMTKREVFEAVGGLSTLFPLNFNDVDYCLKVGAEGHRVAWDPDTILYHFESSSRETKVAPWEMDLFHSRWMSVVWSDPYFHEDLLRTVERPLVAV